MLFRLAWRNLWRNPRRTGLTAGAAVFAAFLCLVSLALAAGSHDRWIEHVVRMYPGHVEISLQGYRENRTLDYGMTLGAHERSVLDALPDVDGWTPRLESWALAIPDRDDSEGRAALLVGIDPSSEGRLSTIGQRLASDGMLVEDDALDVVLGTKLARNLGVSVGDPLILLTSDYYGSQAADRFRVVGTLQVGEDAFDNYGAIVRLADLRRFVEYPDGISHVAIFTGDARGAEPTIEKLSASFPLSDYEVLSWAELVPELVQMIVLDDVGNYITMGILVTVVAFGLLNTILMSVFERVREFGVMRAMGVRPRAIFGLVVIESMLISAIGLVVGYALAIPTVLWFEDHPIPLGGEGLEGVFAMFGIEPLILFRLATGQLVVMAVVLTVVALLAALPPAVRASRGRPVDALREA